MTITDQSLDEAQAKLVTTLNCFIFKVIVAAAAFCYAALSTPTRNGKVSWTSTYCLDYLATS